MPEIICFGCKKVVEISEKRARFIKRSLTTEPYCTRECYRKSAKGRAFTKGGLKSPKH